MKTTPEISRTEKSKTFDILKHACDQLEMSYKGGSDYNYTNSSNYSII